MTFKSLSYYRNLKIFATISKESAPGSQQFAVAEIIYTHAHTYIHAHLSIYICTYVIACTASSSQPTIQSVIPVSLTSLVEAPTTRTHIHTYTTMYVNIFAITKYLQCNFSLQQQQKCQPKAYHNWHWSNLLAAAVFSLLLSWPLYKPCSLSFFFIYNFVFVIFFLLLLALVLHSNG